MSSSQILGDQSLCTYEIIYLFLKGCKCHVLLPYLLWGRFGFNPKTLKGNKEIRIITLFSHLHVREMWDKRRITLPMLGSPVCHPNLDLSWLSTYTWHYVIFFNKYQSSLLTFIKQATTFSSGWTHDTTFAFSQRVGYVCQFQIDVLIILLISPENTPCIKRTSSGPCYK